MKTRYPFVIAAMVLASLGAVAQVLAGAGDAAAALAQAGPLHAAAPVGLAPAARVTSPL